MNNITKAFRFPSNSISSSIRYNQTLDGFDLHVHDCNIAVVFTGAGIRACDLFAALELNPIYIPGGEL